VISQERLVTQYVPDFIAGEGSSSGIELLDTELCAADGAVDSTTDPLSWITQFRQYSLRGRAGTHQKTALHKHGSAAFRLPGHGGTLPGGGRRRTR
jgi:hypothetical protein